MKFIKDSVRELKHVVWPTRKETNKYFLIVTIILVLFGLYLFFFATLFGNGLNFLKNFVNPSVTNQTQNTTIDSIIPTSTWSVSASGTTQTGTVVTPVLVETNTGTVSVEIATWAVLSTWSTQTWTTN